MELISMKIWRKWKFFAQKRLVGHLSGQHIGTLWTVLIYMGRWGWGQATPIVMPTWTPILPTGWLFLPGFIPCMLGLVLSFGSSSYVFQMSFEWIFENKTPGAMVAWKVFLVMLGMLTINMNMQATDVAALFSTNVKNMKTSPQKSHKCFFSPCSGWFLLMWFLKLKKLGFL